MDPSAWPVAANMMMNHMHLHQAFGSPFPPPIPPPYLPANPFLPGLPPTTYLPSFPGVGSFPPMLSPPMNGMVGPNNLGQLPPPPPHLANMAAMLGSGPDLNTGSMHASLARTMAHMGVMQGVHDSLAGPSAAAVFGRAHAATQPEVAIARRQGSRQTNLNRRSSGSLDYFSEAIGEPSVSQNAHRVTRAPLPVNNLSELALRNVGNFDDVPNGTRAQRPDISAGGDGLYFSCKFCYFKTRIFEKLVTHHNKRHLRDGLSLAAEDELSSNHSMVAGSLASYFAGGDRNSTERQLSNSYLHSPPDSSVDDPYAVFRLNGPPPSTNLRWIDSGNERVIQIAPVDDLAEDSVDEQLQRVVSRTPVQYMNDASAMSDDSDVVCVFSGHTAPPHIIAPLDSEDGSRTPSEHPVDDLQALRNLYPLLTVGGSVNSQPTNGIATGNCNDGAIQRLATEEVLGDRLSVSCRDCSAASCESSSSVSHTTVSLAPGNGGSNASDTVTHSEREEASVPVDRVLVPTEGITSIEDTNDGASPHVTAAQLSMYSLLSPSNHSPNLVATTNKESQSSETQPIKETFQCPLCPFRNSNPLSAERHMQAHGDSEKTCPFCCRAFADAGNRRRHIEASHKDKLEQLDSSAVQLLFSQQLSPRSNVQCTLCGRKFAAYKNLRKHMRCRHGNSGREASTQLSAAVVRNSVVSGNIANAVMARLDTFVRGTLFSSRLACCTVSADNDIIFVGVPQPQFLDSAANIPSLCSVEEAQAVFKTTPSHISAALNSSLASDCVLPEQCMDNTVAYEPKSVNSGRMNGSGTEEAVEQLNCQITKGSSCVDSANVSTAGVRNDTLAARNKRKRNGALQSVDLARRPLFVLEHDNNGEHNEKEAPISVSEQLERRRASRKSCKWLKCAQCAYQTLNADTLRQHTRMHKRSIGTRGRPQRQRTTPRMETLVCRLCLSTSPTLTIFSHHWLSHARDIVDYRGLWECGLCEVWEQSEDDLRSHMLTHS